MILRSSSLIKELQFLLYMVDDGVPQGKQQPLLELYGFECWITYRNMIAQRG